MNRIPNSNYKSRDQNLVDSEENDQMEIIEAYNPETKLMLERFILMLIAVGLIVGAILSVGVVYILDKTGFTTPPNQQKIDLGQ
ncbi:MAG: hypothetical protein O4861_20490 [Trichodesmium sp. St16_bin4-tuft]|uniref:Uncharacterized protein n=1 Tax=Trichodesmium erythraeum (strain IMS101) TaxID=203124 RepID=Q113T3_TRIEI|nr:hypothetical protein [Trichodesmium erythraeum GBRTRLIN201]MCL2927776.1 hypothetical protein [Trichodesmium sp. MAG_R01]MDE5067855.1 hypothetical protein [Trichodesmium sp. St4_bin8_1]MDE5073800.1 hypothetical protein [Trichodesmium sp. St5_bin8]MDE5078949.1 hypothetical protein [Trichodesmium sp. St2_bin6]MDE5094588.1 hypothetical protein [Trichodesmium sp. St11_bin5]MDE5100582.1 hypothetical protein [Trichodesmium sp. St16_bin4-tuft]MDE5104988.1 hypothetical protein [Trichodesmium sp. S